MTARNNIYLDFTEALKLTAVSSWRKAIVSWLHVPIGILSILFCCWGVNRLIGLSSVSFPASVALLILLFFALIGCDYFLGDRRTRGIVRILDIPAGFALKYINVFFLPAFVLLPLSPSISGVEIAKIIAVLLVGFAVMMVTMAFLVRGLQLLLGSSKRALTERAEEMGVENDSIPLTQREESIAPSIYTQGSTVGNMDSLPSPPISAQDPSSIRGTGGPPADPGNIRETLSPLIIHQDPAPLTQVQQRAAVMSKNVDIITYGALFLFVGIPIYYSTGYAMPMHLSLSVLAYFAALALPPNYKKVLHPVLVSSVIIVPSIWIFALTRRSTLHASLEAYSTGTKYLQVWSNQKDLRRPGAGDVFSSVLDASIVSLALPMFQYRAELRRHFLSIIIPNVVISIASLFGYPSLCYAIGIAPKQSLSFAARSLTLALAQPATANLGGDLTLVAVLCITSGILGVIFGPTMLKWLRIPDDDYVTRGVTLGGNSSALATALLLVTDPRAAALSSLSMGLFGAIMVALTSVPPIARAVAGLVGL